jgi:hypothetical protein
MDSATHVPPRLPIRFVHLEIDPGSRAIGVALAAVRLPRIAVPAQVCQDNGVVL